jgi:diguanylate cyclase (GGDEF)-like protein
VGRFAGTSTSFLEAAVSLFAFSIARMASEEATQHSASHDGLTGLPNRSQLLDELTRLLDDDDDGVEGDEPDKPLLAVIFIDIDGFKQVNDTLGHAAGDSVLVEATERLRMRTRPSDVLARLGGDEFVVLCEGGAPAAPVIAKRLLSAFDDPFDIDGRDMFLSASAGIALADAGVTSQQILADADIAMYRAKQTPGSSSVAFHPDMRALAESQSRLHNQLRRALERAEPGARAATAGRQLHPAAARRPETRRRVRSARDRRGAAVHAARRRAHGDCIRRPHPGRPRLDRGAAPHGRPARHG